MFVTTDEGEDVNTLKNGMFCFLGNFRFASHNPPDIPRNGESPGDAVGCPSRFRVVSSVTREPAPEVRFTIFTSFDEAPLRRKTYCSGILETIVIAFWGCSISFRPHCLPSRTERALKLLSKPSQKAASSGERGFFEPGCLLC